eukprot:scaffold15605_cov37-Attheya_sp.AAC.3
MAVPSSHPCMGHIVTIAAYGAMVKAGATEVSMWEKSSEMWGQLLRIRGGLVGHAMILRFMEEGDGDDSTAGGKESFFVGNGDAFECSVE